MREYDDYDALGLAGLVATGQVSAAELLEQAIVRADRYNPALSAIVHRFDERARAIARIAPASGPFAGVPFLFKDLGDEFANEPMAMGSRGIRYVPERHNEIVRRYLAAGVIPFGKTSTPELGLIITTEPKSHEPTHNPWQPGISSGGSSGGAAAVVAARIVPMASGSDGGGSIRFPAACCGVFGFKPSRGRNPSGPRQGEGWGGAVMAHVITRSVRDSAAMLDATAGPEMGAPFVVAPPPGSYLDAAARDPEPLRIGYSSRPMIPADIHREALDGLAATVQLLRDLGHEVEECDPEVDQEQLWRDFSAVVMAYTASLVAQVSGLGESVYRQLEPATISMARMGDRLSAVEFLQAQEGWHRVRQAMGRYLQRYHVLLTPTLIGPPSAHGVLPPSPQEEALLQVTNHLPVARLLYRSGQLAKTMLPVLGQMAFTAVGNITGLPAMSVPLHWTGDGLPLGMQLTGRMADDYTLLQLAGQLERARPWDQRRPPLIMPDTP